MGPQSQPLLIRLAVPPVASLRLLGSGPQPLPDPKRLVVPPVPAFHQLSLQLAGQRLSGLPRAVPPRPHWGAAWALGPNVLWF